MRGGNERRQQLGRAPAWRVVAGAFLVMMVGYGAIYSFAAFAEDIAAEFASTQGVVTVVYSLSGSACYFVSAIAGPLSDRLGPRPLAAGGMLLVGSGLLTASVATSLVEVYLGYGLLIGIGTGCAYVPAVAAVQRCFDANRGLATGVAVSGIGIGTALVPPTAECLSAIGGWRLAFVLCGLLAALVGVIGAALLAPADRVIAKAVWRSGRGCADPVRLRPCVGYVYMGTLLVSLPAVLPHAMLVATARDVGLSRQEALSLLGLIGAGTILGRLLLAAVADAVGRRPIFVATCASLAFSMLFWASADSAGALRAFAIAFGAVQGGFVALLPTFVADSFGQREVGRLIGILFTARGIALLSGPLIFAAGVDWCGGQDITLAGFAALGAAGTVLLARTRIADKRR